MSTAPIAQGPADVNVSRCTVRVKTTVWADKRGLHTKKSLTFLRRTVHNTYDHCEDKALLELLSLEIENASDNFSEYELSDNETQKINARSFSIITNKR